MQNLKFILAGNATFTVFNEHTNNHFTYKVRKPDDDRPHFVSVLTGQDNANDFTFLGTIFPDGFYIHARSSRIAPTAQSNKVFQWLFAKLRNNNLPVCVKVMHQNKCGRCGRALTVPESIESGFGPECINHV